MEKGDNSYRVSNFNGSSSNSGGRSTHTRVVKSQCDTHRTTDGRIIRRCEKIEEEYKIGIGMPDELVAARKLWAEQDITSLVGKASLEPGKHSTNEIDRILLDGLKLFVQAGMCSHTSQNE